MEARYRNVEMADGLVTGEMSYDGVSWLRFGGRLDLTRIQAATRASGEAAARVWQLQDGYGSAGYTPAQGWDWSGIRDSSEEAIAAMNEVAAEYVTDDDLSEMLGLEV